MEKNVASQKWIVFAFDRTDNIPKTGDAAQITANLRLDGGAANATDDVNPLELEDGFYIFDISQAESNADLILMTPASSTADIQVLGVPGAVYTSAPNSNALGIESDGDLTKVNLVDTLTTYTGNTVQTGDNFARIGAPVGASISADIADVPTVSEFNARTIVSANYFDPAADTVATVTTVTNQLTAVTIGNQVWDTDATGRQTLGTFGGAIGDPGANAETIYDAVVSDATGTNVAIDVIAIKADTGTTLPNHLTDIKGTSFIKDTHSLIDIEAYVDVLDDGTSGNVKIATDVAAVLVDTADMQPKIGAPNADVSADIAAVKVDTAVIGALGAGLTDLGGMSTAMKAEVNAEVDTALVTTTYGEPAQGAPGVTLSLKDKIGYLFKAWRNRSNQTATTYQLFSDDATTVDHKATVSDDTTTAEKGEVATGP